DFAELLVDTVASVDWAFFAKNGNDVTSLAIMTARAHTHRKKIVFFKGYYHGVSPWTQKIDDPGIIEEDVMHNIYVPWNDIDALEEVFAANRGQIAAVIGQPYMHGNFADNVLPTEGFWQRVRALCSENETVLVVDDVRAGFRLDIAGSDHYFGFEADLICFCKAIANGHNVSALCGKNFLKSTVSGLSYTGSYWMSAVPFAAGIACIEKLKRIGAPGILIDKGEKLKSGLIAAATECGYDLHVSGVPSLFYLRLADDPSLMLHQRWIAECVKRGAYLTNHHNHFINAALTDADIAETVEIAKEAFAAIGS
ncbi:MAG: aminotransferase class III-fold pyridoxal phosphate-dependent enzyme, partial [Clostridia bacterium]|nr:aminotransferase class III-fold pyridoxal phosphate-dependent enzyme [Clostridia bacterium]